MHESMYVRTYVHVFARMYEFVDEYMYIFKFVYFLFHLHTEPTTIPTGIRLKSLKKTSVIVKWDNSPSFENEAVETFLITLKILNRFAVGDTFIHKQFERLTTPKVHIGQLIPNTVYELRIAAVNGEGTGPSSSPVTFTTKGDRKIF